MSGPRYHRQRHQNERLIGFECQGCGWVSLPEPKQVCKRCADHEAGFTEVALADEAEILTFVEQQVLPDDFEPPLLLAMVDIPQINDGEPARSYGLLTETDLDEVEIGDTVEARYRELFTDGDRPINSFKFSVPREEKR